MKTKIVYVVVADKNSIYLEQAYVSVWSLKYYNPDASVTFVMDNRTKKYWDVCGYDELKTLVDEVIVREFEDNVTNHYRSRWLKTNIRALLTGDLLFIDTDTIIHRDISSVDNVAAPLCACWDTHTLFQSNPYYEMCVRDVGRLGMDISKEEIYYNSGVIYAKDTTIVHEFFKSWHSNYLKGLSMGVRMDQPSFALTNISLDYPVKRLHDSWNCELKHGIRWLNDSYIIHYLCTNTSDNADCQFFWLNDRRAFSIIKESHQIPQKIKEIVNDPFKGIAEVTHCFAGQDIHFFQTATYNIFNRIFHKYGKDIITGRLIKCGRFIKSKLLRI